MSYVVIKKYPKGKEEISLDQILFSDTNSGNKNRSYPGTVTRNVTDIQMSLYTASDIDRIIEKLRRFNLMASVKDASKYYKHFQIPKRSGGLRDIDAPDRFLTARHSELKEILEQDCNAAYHTAAFAYAKGRNTKSCVKRHQANDSKWFLHLDFSNFFGSTNKDFVMRQLSMIAPFDAVMQNENGKKYLSDALEICFLNDGLPQGTVISPMLTNLVMIPIDFEINKALHRQGFVYTRYADDMQISSKSKFNYNEVIKLIEKILKQFDAPYEIKASKTHFGSSAGHNYHLGLAVNKDNMVTIGHVKHKQLKAKMTNFILDTKNKKFWCKKDIDVLNGEVGYWKYIEPAQTIYTLNHLSEKFGCNVEFMLKHSYTYCNEKHNPTVYSF